MKKKWIPFLVIASAILFSTGLLAGSATEVSRREQQKDTTAKINDAIAVVNSDIGAIVDGEKQNYAAVIIDSLGQEYSLVSSAMAANGYSNGSYCAVITFPSDVSEKILSLNTASPEKVMLEFIVNPNLSEEKYIDVYTKILKLQLMLNQKISYTYVTSIFDEFHSAQDKTDAIFENDKSDMQALESVKLQRFTEALNWGDIPQAALDPKNFDEQPFLEDLGGLADDMSSFYLDSYAQAKAYYAILQTDMNQSADSINQQTKTWIGQLDAWKLLADGYTSQLKSYATALENRKDDLLKWRGQLTDSNEKWTEYEDGLKLWYDSLDIWYDDAKDWYERVKQYGKELEEFRDGENGDDGFSKFYDDMNKWYGEFINYADQLLLAPDTIFDAIETYNDHVENYNNNALPSIQGWYNQMQPFSAASLKALSYIKGRPEKELYMNNDTLDVNLYQSDLLAWALSLSDSDFNQIENASDNFPGDPGLDLEELKGIEDDIVPRHDLSIIPVFFEKVMPTLEIEETIEAPPQYGGSDQPDTAEDAPELKVEIPKDNTAPTPPKPETLESTVSSLKTQLASYDAEAYLTDSVRSQVNSSVNTYGQQLKTAGVALQANHMENVQLLMEAYGTYNEYVYNLRSDALKSEADEQEKLQTILGDFYNAKEKTSQDNRVLLSGFANKIPLSRTGTGVNSDLVQFTVSPLDFILPSKRKFLRDDMASLQQQVRLVQNILIGLTIAAIFALAFTLLRSFLLAKRKNRGRD